MLVESLWVQVLIIMKFTEAPDNTCSQNFEIDVISHDAKKCEMSRVRIELSHFPTGASVYDACTIS